MKACLPQREHVKPARDGEPGIRRIASTMLVLKCCVQVAIADILLHLYNISSHHRSESSYNDKWASELTGSTRCYTIHTILCAAEGPCMSRIQQQPKCGIGEERSKKPGEPKSSKPLLFKVQVSPVVCLLNCCCRVLGLSGEVKLAKTI